MLIPSTRKGILLRMKTILLVDDDSDTRNILRLRLEREFGFRVAEAGNGREAVDLVRREPPDMVILDWFIPGLTGIEVLTHLREHDPAAALPVIMMSGADLPGIEAKAKALGALAFLRKPIDFGELKRSIQEVFPEPRPLQ